MHGACLEQAPCASPARTCRRPLPRLPASHACPSRPARASGRCTLSFSYRAAGRPCASADFTPRARRPMACARMP